MPWIELLCAIIFFAVAFGAIFLFWYLEKPERDLRKKRLEEAVNFYHSAGYVFNHIACNLEQYVSDHEIITACFDANLKLMEDK